MAKSYYNILGVSKTASADEIKRAFRKLAHKYHPDKEGGDEKKFKEINEAYQVLANAEKRQQYDQFGRTFEQAQSQGGFSGFDGFRDFSGFANGFGTSNMEDIFGDFFGMGRGRGRTRSARGRDIEMEISLDFREAIFGGEKLIELYKPVACAKCQGSGNDLESKIIDCHICGGSGQVKKVQQTILGAFQSLTTCRECLGEGKKAEKRCGQCAGSGTVEKETKIKIKIPAGIDKDEVIKLTGEGEAGERGAAAGNLYLHVRVKDDPEFERAGQDILTKLPINFSQVALGDKIEVKTLDGRVKLKIPAGTQSGKVFRLRGKGVPNLRGLGRGDMLVEVIVRTPSRLSRKAKKLFQQLAEEREEGLF